MVQIGPVHVDLPKAGQTFVYVAVKQSAVQPCALIENDFRSGTKADDGFGSSGDAKPRVSVPENPVTMMVLPAWAGLDDTSCKL